MELEPTRPDDPPPPLAPPPFTADLERLDHLDTSCVEVRGTLQDVAGEQLGAAIEAEVPTGKILIDLREAVVPEPATVTDLVARLARRHRGQLAVTCPRSAGRSVLRRAGVEAVAPVFGSRGDALQALIMEAGGLGDGWTPFAPIGPAGTMPTPTPRPTPTPTSDSRRHLRLLGDEG